MKYKLPFVIFGLALLIVLSGCAQTTVKEYVPIKVQVQKAPKPDPLSMKPVHFLVKSSTDPKPDLKSYIVLSLRDYENLAFNTSEIISYIKKQKAIIEYYENLITDQTDREDTN